MVELDSMAGDGRDGGCRLDDCVTKKVQTQLGVLGFSVKQRVVDNLGTIRPRLCFNPAATGVGNFECARHAEDTGWLKRCKPQALRQQRVIELHL
jgi:hypothetical protein